jgi:formate hydrogenlyase subunit 4
MPVNPQRRLEFIDQSPRIGGEIVVPQTASWLFWVTPVVAFTCMLTVPLLIPVLTN